MKKYCILFILVIVISIFFSREFFSTVSASTPSDFGLKEGDLISAIFSDDPDVYIINEHGYKRLFLNPEIFKFYTHLGGFTNVKLVTPEIRDAFPTSGLFRNCEKNDLKVYGFESDNEDKGKLRWVDTPGEQAVKDDPDFFKKVFCINDREFKWYPKGQELKSVKEVSQYHRATPATPAIPAVPASPSHPFTPIASTSQPLIPSITPKSASGSFTPTPTPISVTQPATPAIPATSATPAQPASFISTPTPTLTSSPSLSPVASVSATPTPTSIFVPSVSPALKLLYPNGGEQIISGGTVAVRWEETTGSIPSYLYYLRLRDNNGYGQLWWSNDSLSGFTTSWWVTAPMGSGYKIQVLACPSGSGTCYSDESDNSFSIITPTPTPVPSVPPGAVLGPNGSWCLDSDADPNSPTTPNFQTVGYCQDSVGRYETDRCSTVWLNNEPHENGVLDYICVFGENVFGYPTCKAQGLDCATSGQTCSTATSTCVVAQAVPSSKSNFFSSVIKSFLRFFK